MSVNEVALAEPFAPSVADEEVELRALCRALTLGEGFSLLFARCNQADHRRDLIAKVREKLPDLKVQLVELREPINHLLDELRDRLTETAPDAVFVLGLEYSLRTSDEARSSPLIANLNASRNSFPRVVRCPMVLWVPEYIVTAISRGAPDFFSIRSGIYYFVASPKDMVGTVQSLTGRDSVGLWNLTVAEKQERIESIRSLLSDFENLPTDRRDLLTEGRLHYQLGDLLALIGSDSEARIEFEKSLSIAESLDHQNGIAAAHYGIGTICEHRGEYLEALKHYRHALAVAEELGDRLGAATSIHRIATIHELRGEYEAALQEYQHSLAISEDLGDRVGIAGALHQIGTIHHRQGDYSRALEYYQRSLATSQALGYLAGEASTLQQIGLIHQHRGEYDAALENYQRSLKIEQEIGNRAGAASSQLQIGIVHQHRHNYEAALEYYERSLAINEEIDRRLGVATTRGQMAKLFTVMGRHAEAFQLLMLAYTALVQLQSPQAEIAANNLKELRLIWGEEQFDAAWQQAQGESVPDWLK